MATKKFTLEVKQVREWEVEVEAASEDEAWEVFNSYIVDDFGTPRNTHLEYQDFVECT